MTNIVEVIADPGECAFDQPCKFGNRVDGHAVYCHNELWEDSPRKCRRTWSSGGETKGEDCPGFQPNQNFKGTLNASAIAAPLCSRCNGLRLNKTDGDHVKTCDRCAGDGSEPKAVVLTQFAQDTLEMGFMPGAKERRPFVRLGESKEESEQIWRLVELSLISLSSVTYGKSCHAYLLVLTGKGEATMRANWAAKKKGR